jgi:hypothetical protein
MRSARRIGETLNFTFYDASSTGVDGDERVALQHPNELTEAQPAYPISGQSDKGQTPETPDLSKLARLRAQGAIITTEIAACVQLAIDNGDLGIISSTHAAIVQAQVTNAQDISDISGTVASAPPTEETTADIRKRLNKAHQ